jgi:phosphoribosylformimino-5-aminoimidazole carboxamide ribotide isomerase
MLVLIPAIDIIGGKCVRLTQGDYSSQKTYNNDPLDTAKLFEDCGVHRLHLVDLDGAREGRTVNLRTLETIATKTSLTIDFGGGLNSDADVGAAFSSGAAMITGGSIAVKQPDVFYRWIERFGTDKIILGADAKDEKIAVGGWKETTDNDLLPFIRHYAHKGIRNVICTDIGRDGMLQGPAVELYSNILHALPDIYLIASGGISSVHDFEKLELVGVKAAIFGKAFYEGRISIKELSNYNIC